MPTEPIRTQDNIASLQKVIDRRYALLDQYLRVQENESHIDISRGISITRETIQHLEGIHRIWSIDVAVTASLVSTYQPPQSLECLLCRCAGRNIDSLLGDLEDQYNTICARAGKREAQLWYCSEVLCSCGLFMVKRFTRWSRARDWLNKISG